MTALRSILFNITFYCGTILFGIICLPTLLLPTRFSVWVADFWTRFCVGCAKYICGIDWRVTGQEHMPAGSVIYACRHESAWETLALWFILNRPLAILKKELLWLPLFGWFLKKIGNIAINRGAGAGAMRGMITDAIAKLEQGHSILIFPEGTRVPPHQTHPFNPGIAALYGQANIPVVPVALNSGLCWSRNAFLKKPGLITVQLLPPIAPGLQSRDFLTQLEQVINEATAKLE